MAPASFFVWTFVSRVLSLESFLEIRNCFGRPPKSSSLELPPMGVCSLIGGEATALKSEGPSFSKRERGLHLFLLPWHSVGNSWDASVQKMCLPFESLDRIRAWGDHTFLAKNYLQCCERENEGKNES